MARASGAGADEALAVAAAVESFHTASLVLDDLPSMDDSETRRGRPSTHRTHGEALIDWVLRASEHDPLLPYPALLVLGPFMHSDRQTEFIRRAAKLKRVDTITFYNHLETLVARAAGVVAMGGYNTFCEVLSLDKRALIVPRTTPRLEQFIRASRASSLGLVSMLADDGRHDPETMATALRALPRRNRPSEVVVPGLLEGLENVARLVAPWVTRERAADGASEVAAQALPRTA